MQAETSVTSRPYYWIAWGCSQASLRCNRPAETAGALVHREHLFQHLRRVEKMGYHPF